MFKSHFARPPTKCDTAFHEVRPCTPCETNLARQGKRGWAVRFHGLLHPTQALGHTHRTVRPALQVPSVGRACSFPVSRYRLIILTRQRRVPGTAWAVELPAPCLPRSEPAYRNSMGLLSQQPGAVWHMTQSPFGRLRCDMCIFIPESQKGLETA